MQLFLDAHMRCVVPSRSQVHNSNALTKSSGLKIGELTALPSLPSYHLEVYRPSSKMTSDNPPY